MSLNVTIKQLRAFVAVAETGSFTRAAERLFVTQSALSVIIRELEYEVGLKLLDRTTRTVVLTAAGSEFLKSAARVLSDLECGIRDTRELMARQQGQVTLGVPPLAAATFVPDMIVKLRAAHPEIGIILRDLRPDEIAASAATGEIDFGLGTFDETSEPLHRVVVARQPFTVTFPPGHPLATPPAVKWSDLLGFPLITIARDHTVRRLLDHTFGQMGRNTFPAYEVYHALTAIAMVVAGLGIAIFPQWICAASPLYDIRIRNIEEPVVMSELSLVSHPDRESSPAMKQVESFLSAYIAGLNWSADNHQRQ